jgi:hypothetical protein
MNKKIIIILLIMLLITTTFSGCFFLKPKGRLSGTVLFIHSSPTVQNWLQEPKKSFVQAYFMFPTDFASDIIFGIDQEFIEGVNDPIHFPGADWMALVGLTRTGILNIPVGTSKALNGTPSDASVWKYIDLGVELKPNTWYLMRETADFHSRRFETFTLVGPDMNITVDLRDYYVDYPNYIPIDNRSLTYYVFAIRMSPYVQPGSTSIYFDDIKAGIETISGYEVILTNGFELQSEIPNLPITLPVSPLADMLEFYWYRENDNAKVQIVDDYTRSGDYSCKCNATLDNLGKMKFVKFLFR